MRVSILSHSQSRALPAQNLSKSRGVRVSILTGDVHVGGYAQVYSRPVGDGADLRDPQVPLERDPCFIPEIISSAMGNDPPPPAVVHALEAVGMASLPVLQVRGRCALLHES